MYARLQYGSVSKDYPNYPLDIYIVRNFHIRCVLFNIFITINSNEK